MKILISHNSQSRARQYRDVLEKRGHIVFDALTDCNCLKIYSEFHQHSSLTRTDFQFIQYFDCIILVYDRRLIDGLELAGKIWDLNPYQRIVFSTLYKGAATKYLNREHDSLAEYLIGPFSTKKLIEVVEEKQIYTYLEKLNIDSEVIRFAEFSHHQLMRIVGILQKDPTSGHRRLKCPNCGCTPFDCAKSPTPAECANCMLDTCCCWKIIKK
jgi:two-component SAPR family response regulator